MGSEAQEDIGHDSAGSGSLDPVLGHTDSRVPEMGQGVPCGTIDNGGMVPMAGLRPAPGRIHLTWSELSQVPLLQA